MSTIRAREWLVSHNGQQTVKKGAYLISVTSGKGGVGKTSICLKLSTILARRNHKVLLIDCDYNLSNVIIKLKLPLNDNFYSLVTHEKSFDDCLYRNGNFHLLSGCNGHLDLFENKILFEQLILDIISSHKFDYDYILLDCPAGLTKEFISLNAKCDYRFIIVTPDKSSITDSYSLIKLLRNKYDINSNHLIVNKVSSPFQYQRVKKSLIDTSHNFLKTDLNALGSVKFYSDSIELFDKELLKNADSYFYQDFSEILDKFDEEIQNNHLLNKREFKCHSFQKN